MSTKQDDIRDGGAGLGFIAGEGIFPVELDFVSINKTENGAAKVNFNVLYKGEPQTIYGPTIMNKPLAGEKEGQPNKIGMSLVHKLGVIVGLEDGQEFTIEEEVHAVGKDRVDTTFDVITDFSDAEVYLHVVREYSRYNGEIRSALSIRNVFRAHDCASAAEIENNKDFGKQYEISLEKYCNPVYRDGVTAEEAEAFEEQRKASRGKSASPSPTSAVVAKRTSAFGMRK